MTKTLFSLLSTFTLALNGTEHVGFFNITAIQTSEVPQSIGMRKEPEAVLSLQHDEDSDTLPQTASSVDTVRAADSKYTCTLQGCLFVGLKLETAKRHTNRYGPQHVTELMTQAERIAFHGRFVTNRESELNVKKLAQRVAYRTRTDYKAKKKQKEQGADPLALLLDAAQFAARKKRTTE